MIDQSLLYSIVRTHGTADPVVNHACYGQLIVRSNANVEMEKKSIGIL
jgi:hypothetical protein